MAFSHIKNLLHKTIGLHVESVGESSIDRAINQRMKITDCKSASAYYKFIKEDKAELEELIEEVVVPETWFFRNVTPFEVLRDAALKIYDNAVKTKKTVTNQECEIPQLNVLSIPCSNGEEPYSIAMMLNESGLKKENYRVDAVDVSYRALKKARLAIYGNHSFREQGMKSMDRYFEEVKTGFRVIPSISESVSFKQGNILADPISPSAGYYDVIFCRNLLIYFDRETQKTILDKLSTMLKYGGLLFVGHAEAGQIDKNKFTKLRISKAFSFRKKTTNKMDGMIFQENEQPVSKLKDIYDQLVEVTKKDIALSKKINSPKYKAFSKEDKMVESSFSKVAEMISMGLLFDAAKVCEYILEKSPENPDAYYYLGLISNLQGSDGGAEALLRKAIYLSPNHHNALALSAVLAERRGDEDGAKSLRRREKKARDRNSSS